LVSKVIIHISAFGRHFYVIYDVCWLTGINGPLSQLLGPLFPGRQVHMKARKSGMAEPTSYALQALTPIDAPALQALFDCCADFFELAEGEPVPPDAGHNIFTEGPPDWPLDDKFIFGVACGEAGLAAVLEGMWNYPEAGVGWIGLLLLDPASRGQGLGRWCSAAFDDLARQRGCTAAMLGVVEQNLPAQAFWSCMGYETVRVTEPQSMGNKIQRVIIMRKPL
jgi:GNAT superfamily N-acetyltransferase